MKKTFKKIAAVGLTLTSVMSLVACGSGKKGSDNKGDDGDKAVDWSKVEKPGKFTVCVDNTVVTEANGGNAFYDALKEATGLDIEWVRPDHKSYYESVQNYFATGDAPDVVLLSSDYLALYANSGYLWDMTDAWENSATKNSGRLISSADKIMNANSVLGADGEYGIYGFSPFRGNGCCTYVKTAWLEAAGLKASDYEKKEMTFSEYYDLLKKLKAASSSDYVISAPGWISAEAPYTNYLPEFYQKANYTFYLKDGQFVDGFSEQAMQDALQRIQDAVKDGIIDKESNGQGTSDARNKFFSTNPKTESGVFTYWAGTWADTLKSNLSSKGLDDNLIAIYPIKELGAYTERLSTAWAITIHAYENGNAEGIFKYFIDTMLDGDAVQMLWTYGAKGTHWDVYDKDTEFTLAADSKGNVKTVKATAGKLVMLPSPETPTAQVKKNHIDPVLSLANFKDGTLGAASKGVSDNVAANFEMFSAHSEVATPLPMTTALANNISDINAERNTVIANVATGQMSVADGMAEYKKVVGDKVEESLKSLNDLLK
ncbi:MAG: ABC transporter substrate-binding protein [Lachnospira sp.]